MPIQFHLALRCCCCFFMFFYRLPFLIDKEVLSFLKCHQQSSIIALLCTAMPTTQRCCFATAVGAAANDRLQTTILPMTIMICSFIISHMYVLICTIYSFLFLLYLPLGATNNCFHISSISQVYQGVCCCIDTFVMLHAVASLLLSKYS